LHFIFIFCFTLVIWAATLLAIG